MSTGPCPREDVDAFHLPCRSEFVWYPQTHLNKFGSREVCVEHTVQPWTWTISTPKNQKLTKQQQPLGSSLLYNQEKSNLPKHKITRIFSRQVQDATQQRYIQKKKRNKEGKTFLRTIITTSQAHTGIQMNLDQGVYELLGVSKPLMYILGLDEPFCWA